MALITCPECGKEASDKAEKCPNCAYPFITEEPKEETTEKKTRNNRWIVPVAIIVAVMFIAGMVTILALKSADVYMTEEGASVSSKTPSSETTKVKPVVSTQKKSGTIEEILAADAKDSLSVIRKEYEKLSSKITDYKSLKKNVDKVTDWYAFCVEQSVQLYAQIKADCDAYCTQQAEAAVGNTEAYSRILQDACDAWETTMIDFLDILGEMYVDLFDLIDDIISDAYENGKEKDIDELCETMEKAYDDAEDALEKAFNEAWEDIWNAAYDEYDSTLDVLYHLFS